MSEIRTMIDREDRFSRKWWNDLDEFRTNRASFYGDDEVIMFMRWLLI